MAKDTTPKVSAALLAVLGSFKPVETAKATILTATGTVRATIHAKYGTDEAALKLFRADLKAAKVEEKKANALLGIGFASLIAAERKAETEAKLAKAKFTVSPELKAAVKAAFGTIAKEERAAAFRAVLAEVFGTK